MDPNSQALPILYNWEREEESDDASVTMPPAEGCCWLRESDGGEWLLEDPLSESCWRLENCDTPPVEGDMEFEDSTPMDFEDGTPMEFET
jgi:hypothetical protein